MLGAPQLWSNLVLWSGRKVLWPRTTVIRFQRINKQYIHTIGSKYCGFKVSVVFRQVFLEEGTRLSDSSHLILFCLSIAQVCRFGAACTELCICVLPWIQVGLTHNFFKCHFLEAFLSRLLSQRFLIELLCGQSFCRTLWSCLSIFWWAWTWWTWWTAITAVFLPFRLSSCPLWTDWPRNYSLMTSRSFVCLKVQFVR